MSKNNKIRLIVYPIVVLIAAGLSFYLYYRYREENPKPKLIGLEFCATPEEAVRRYAEALMKADREEALKYVYKPLNDIHRWEGTQRRLYSKTDEELKEEGEEIINNGYLDKKWQMGWGGRADWVVIHNIEGEIIGGPMSLIYIKGEGWKKGS